MRSAKVLGAAQSHGSAAPAHSAADQAKLRLTSVSYNPIHVTDEAAEAR